MSGRDGTTRRRALEWLAASSIAGSLSAIGSTALAQSPPGQSAPKSVPRGSPDSLDVDLNLVLAVDASGSVNQVRFDLQKEGYVSAFANRQVLTAIRSGPNAAIGVMMYQWTGPSMQALVAPWTRIHDEASIDAFAAAIAAGPRFLYGGGTSLSGAIDAGMAVLDRTPFKGGRRVIDISGDGANNRGRPAPISRDAAVAAGVNINGVAILEVEPDLEEHFRNSVIGGPGAFVIAAETFKDFGNAILRKLILEIAGDPADTGARYG
jgi:hypothetical protein